MNENRNQSINGRAISAYHKVTTSKSSFKRENTFLWKGEIFTCTYLTEFKPWSDSKLNLKVKPLASRPGKNDNHIALLNYNFAKEMVTLSRLFQWFKIFDVDYLEFTADSLDPLAEERENQ